MKTEKAIEYFELHKKLLADINLDGLEAHNMAIEALKETQWISVTDRLPEYDQEVLTYDVKQPSGDIEVMALYEDDTGLKYWEDKCSWAWDLDRVTHWKPLPKATEV